MPAPIALSPADAARSAGISLSTVKRLIRSGRLPIRKIGRRTLILSADLELFVKGLPTSRPALPRGERGRFA